jgi:hypothetical protein
MAVKATCKCDPTERCSCVEIVAQMADGTEHCLYIHLPDLVVTGVNVHTDPPPAPAKP